MTSSRIPFRFFVSKVDNITKKYEVELTLDNPISINDKIDKYKCFLRAFWGTMKIEVGEFINIFHPKIEDSDDTTQFVKVLIVDNVDGLVVIKPDILIPTTTLMNASFCMRKAWLSRLFESYGEGNKALLIGNVVHELFQTSMKRGLTSSHEIETIFNNEILNGLTLELYSIQISQADLIAEIKPYIESISRWLKLYSTKNSNGTLFDIRRLHDIENNIWSTKYGFVGKVDLSLEVDLCNKTSMLRTRNLIALELKTGRHTFSNQHVGQVILYSFIMADKYPHLKPSDGFLLYLKDEPKTELIKSNHNVFRDLIILRNNFVQYYNKLGSINEDNIASKEEFIIKGPDPINNERLCSRCEHLLDCSLTYKCFDSQHSTINNFELSNQTISHLKSDDLDFFSKMISLLEIEKQHAAFSDNLSSYFWNTRSEDCEFRGEGLTKMQVKFQDKNVVVFERYTKILDFLPHKLLTVNSDLSINFSLLEDRRVVISEELVSSAKTFDIYGNFCKQLCIITGKINSFTNDSSAIEVLLEKEQINFLNTKAIYRVDFLKNLSNRAMSINFSNILRLMDPDDNRSRELRDIVIRGRFPQYNINNCKIISFSQIYNSTLLSKLNVQQKKAVVGVLRTKCSLIFGSPGSGKTQTTVALIQILAELGYSVLVTSFTHVAVDNILLKLKQSNLENSKQVDFVRIGQKNRINSQLIDYSDYVRTKAWIESGNLGAIESFYQTVPVIAATCLGIFSHPLFFKRKFDFCILDEASQVYLATCLGPIFLSQNFILVGDQKQLPPVIRNQYVRKSGLEESLFARLLNFADEQNILNNDDSIDKFDDDTASNNRCNLQSIRIFPLFIQYRMNCVIMDIANKLTYSNKLKCGSQQVGSASLHDYISACSNSSIMDQYHSSFLRKAIGPNIEDSVIFLDTDGIVQAAEISVSTCSMGDTTSKAKGYVYNDFEARVVVHLVQTLLLIYEKGGLAASDIGIISPFQRQVRHIRELFGPEFVGTTNLEINTVDQYQGRDKEAIIYSCVKSFVAENCDDDLLSQNSNSTSSSSLITTGIIDSELLKDERRLNVAITRAKKKLIIVGNCRTLNRYEPFRKLFSVLESSQFVKISDFNFDDILNHL